MTTATHPAIAKVQSLTRGGMNRDPRYTSKATAGGRQWRSYLAAGARELHRAGMCCQNAYDIACTPTAAADFCERFEVLAVLSETAEAMIVRARLTSSQLAYAKRAVAELPGAKLFEDGDVIAQGPELAADVEPELVIEFA